MKALKMSSQTIFSAFNDFILSVYQCFKGFATINSHGKDEYPLPAITDHILLAAGQFHRTLGSGFEEVIYQRALALELQAQGVN